MLTSEIASRICLLKRTNCVCLEEHEIWILVIIFSLCNETLPCSFSTWLWVQSRKKPEVPESFSTQIITFQAMSGIYLCPVSQGSSSGRDSGKSPGPNWSSEPAAQGRWLHDLSTKDCSSQTWDETKVGIKAWETNLWSRRKGLALCPNRGVWALLNCDQ